VAILYISNSVSASITAALICMIYTRFDSRNMRVSDITSKNRTVAIFAILRLNSGNTYKRCGCIYVGLQATFILYLHRSASHYSQIEGSIRFSSGLKCYVIQNCTFVIGSSPCTGSAIHINCLLEVHIAATLLSTRVNGKVRVAPVLN
jgi:hypothetical protein